MTAAWQLGQPTRLVFGAHTFDTLAEVVEGDAVLLVTTPGFTRRGVTAQVKALLRQRLVAVMDRCQPNPDLDALDAEAVRLRAFGPDVVVAVGGGSALDTAKVLATVLAAPASWTLDKHFRQAAAFDAARSLPIVAVPTTAGTGAEVTPFATVWDHRNTQKYSLARPDLFPTTALLDPVLTLALPEDVTVSTGLDAVSQALESLWNRRANPVTQAWALQSLRTSLPALPLLLEQPSNLGLRSRMMEASLLAGLAISHTRTGLAHSMSYPITGHFDVPHGIACSFSLPAILEFNAATAPDRMQEVAQALGHRDVRVLKQMLSELLRVTGVRRRIEAHVPDLTRLGPLAGEMLTPGRADNMLRTATTEDVVRILEHSVCALMDQ